MNIKVYVGNVTSNAYDVTFHNRMKHFGAWTNFASLGDYSPPMVISAYILDDAYVTLFWQTHRLDRRFCDFRVNIVRAYVNVACALMFDALMFCPFMGSVTTGEVRCWQLQRCQLIVIDRLFARLSTVAFLVVAVSFAVDAWVIDYTDVIRKNKVTDN